jgi:nitroreductase
MGIWEVSQVEENAVHPVLEAIRNRRSVRHFTSDPVPAADLEAILDAGRWAPSGMNNQPWRFWVVTDAAVKNDLAQWTQYGSVIRSAPVAIAVFLDPEACYHPIKDAQAVGACLQNMLLAAYALGYGAVWLGEILKNEDGVRKTLGIQPSWPLQAVVALGRPAKRDQTSSRRPLAALMPGSGF